MLKLWHSIAENNQLKSFYDKAIFLAFFLVLITYPFSVNINSITIILLVALSLMKLIRKKKIYYSKIYLLFFLFFILRLLSLVYTDNLSAGTRAIERSLSLIAFPFVFMISKPIFQNRLFFLKVLSISTTVACIYCITQNYLFFFSNDVPVKWWFDWKFNNHNLSSHLGFGANYFSVLIIINLIGIYFYNIKSFKQKVIFITIYIIQLFFLFLLSSRSIMLYFLVCTFIVLIYKNYNTIFGIAERGFSILE